MIIAFLLAAITFVAAVSQLIAYRRMYSYVIDKLQSQARDYRPKVAVILPCKGIDLGFRENIKKLLEQDYLTLGNSAKLNFEIIFAVATEADPAYSVIGQLLAECPRLPARLVVSGINPRRAQKINNQLYALKHISSDVEVLVFVDSDVIARNDFIRYLVAPLADSTVGITTGYRFYIPFRGDWPSLLRSLWNRVTAWELASDDLSFAWGGAMAITKVNFAKARIVEVWDQAADDDLSMTMAIKELGLRIVFVPQCLVASNGDASLSEVVEWTNRQLILTKVYYPALWRKAIGRASVLAFWLVAFLGCALEGIINHNQPYQLAFGLGLSLLLVEIFFLLKAQRLWRMVLFHGSSPKDRPTDIDRAYDQSLVRSLWVLPLAHFLLPWMTLNSLFTNRIRWRGVTYELKGPNETIIV